jgi:hypothetical protein
MLTRGIDLEAFDFPIAENFSRYSKRTFVAIAVAAVAIAGFDLISAGGVKSAVAHVRNGGEINFAEFSGRVRAGISQISVLPVAPSVTLAIPRDAAPKVADTFANKVADKRADKRESLLKIADASKSAPKFEPAPKLAVKTGPSPVAALAAARQSDAIEIAMVSPMMAPMPAPAPSSPSASSMPAYALAADISAPSAPEPIKLASIDPGSLIGASMMPQPIPLAMVPMPRAAPGVPPPSPAQRLKLDDKGYAKAERCLANAVYWESRSEPLRGQEAVAQVVMNRVFSGFYPNDVCSVVYQNAHRHLACQFTFACDGKRKVINERGAWARANRIARQTLDGKIYVPAVAKSTHYHATYVHPYWTREMRKLVRYGIHNFYRPYAWGNGAEEPVWGTAALAENKKK